MASYSSSVIYDGFNFGDHGLVLTNINHLTLPSRDNQLEKIANQNGSVLVQSQLGTKPIILEGYYIGSSIADAQAMYDTLAQALNRQQRTLTVPHAGGTRSYIATPTNLSMTEPDGLNRLLFSFEFVVPDGKSTDTTLLTLVSSTVTTSNASPSFTVDGSAVARPLISLTFTSVTGGTGASVNIRNARDFVGLTITRNFASGDTITIDSANYQLYINGILTVPVGRFPSWQPGTGSLYYSDTFTARSVNISMTYKKGNL